MLINVSDTSSSLSQLLDHALKGEKVFLCQRNIPVAELVPLAAHASIPGSRNLKPYPKAFQFSPEVLVPLEDAEIDALFFPPPEPNA